MKKKLLIVILLCLGIGTAYADEVINIDLNNYGNATPYTGTAVVDDGINRWNVYYGSWGLPMGSPRSANLAGSTEPCQPSTYAAQVWIGDPGVDHNYVTGAGDGLMDDGFINNPAIAGDPNIRLWGRDAYGGTFDVYVYGSETGSFTLTRGGVVIGTKTVTGGITAGQFVEGGNYVVFPAVNISNDPDFLLIKYSNIINGIQLVKQKDPIALQNGTEFGFADYDVAFETNGRGEDDQPFGPDLIGPDDWSPYGYISYLDSGEYMEYDFTMDELNEGEYNVYVIVDVLEYDANNMDLYINDLFLGTAKAPYSGGLELAQTAPLTVNIFGGSDVQTFKWEMSALYYHNAAYFRFERIGPINMPDCDAVYRYGFEYAGDFNRDCKIDFKDLDMMTEQWLSCIDPNENNCP
ncbi:MAG: hypothetical protein A2Y10_10000 [Planctomycetes bacterium GWF2_41_51]|nr:MAG: hypothetical protein A2Y10_10000 [Planctomycetes bacterium GWF2_41_51]HBG26440.1 hypothetical protein [Phycisphaerales bacterium]